MTNPTFLRKLTQRDNVEGFHSGASDLDQWLTRFAWENQKANNAVTYVITDGERVIGYYAIAMSAVARDAAPQAINPDRRPTQIPCILLARLAVCDSYQGQGLGAILLRDAVVRGVGLSSSIGAAAILIHCRDESAKSFYLANGDFYISPVDQLQLMVPIKALSRYLSK